MRDGLLGVAIGVERDLDQAARFVDHDRVAGAAFDLQVRGGGVETIRLYRQGDFVDMCRGPHLPDTGRVKAFKLLAAAGAWVSWEGLSSVVLIAALAGLVAAMLSRVAGRPISAGQPIPFGLYLCLGTWLVWLYGPFEFA